MERWEVTLHLTTAEIVSIIIAFIGSIGVVTTSIIGKHNSPKASEIEEEAPLSAELIEALQKLKEATQDNIDLSKKMSELSKQLDEVQSSLEQEQQERRHEHQLRLDDDRKIKKFECQIR